MGTVATRAAEQSLIAANANIGVASASYFRQISLTGSIRGQSSTPAKLLRIPGEGERDSWVKVNAVPG
jgi:outer membrane protein TolC